MECDAIQRETQCNRAPARGKERGGKPFFVFFAKNSAPECSMAFFKGTKFSSFSSLTKKAKSLKTAYMGSGLKKLRDCATVTGLYHVILLFDYIFLVFQSASRVELHKLYCH